MDEEEKKRLFEEKKREFLKDVDDLFEEIKRLKKEFAPDDEKPWYGELVLSSVDVGIVFRALQKYKVFLEHFCEGVKPGSPAYMDLDSQIEATKEMIGIVEEVLLGRGTLIFKKSNETVW